MFNSSLQIYILIGFITLAIFALCWYLLFIMLRVPDDNREYFDDPPLFYKMFGFFINVVAFYLAPFIKDKTYIKYERQIIYAGVEFQFKPEHIIASKIISAIVFTLFVLILLTIAKQSLFLALIGTLFGYVYPDLWLKEAKNKRLNSISKNLPFFFRYDNPERRIWFKSEWCYKASC